MIRGILINYLCLGFLIVFRLNVVLTTNNHQFLELSWISSEVQNNLHGIPSTSFLMDDNAIGIPIDSTQHTHYSIGIVVAIYS